ncbi:heavy metal-associated isoprenylated plant protein 3-like isoform X2 [Pistacia vera]|uniref:heavy metal-associated isoprenylated plant protein 3-like isoform X2 n=1 Tax=Pistacia vera TaxID=55513 RepID=UPI001262D60E|nr:heavy metal-associated isoprenylated plant protein 3-like isoform X2 [Pistacia vera]
MVLRCKGFSQEQQEPALNGLTQEVADLPLNSVNNQTPSQNDAQKSKGQKANGNKRANQIINFILIVNSYSYVNELEHFVKQINGVKSVKGDRNSVRLEVMGNVDPLKVKEMVERETKKKVELEFPSAEMEGDSYENKGTEAKLKKRIKTVHKNDIANNKTEERLFVLKIKLCCNSCNQKLRKNLKIKGLDIVAMDVVKDLVKVKGMADLTELRSYIKTELKKDVEIVIPTEVMVPVKKGNGTTKKKEKFASNIDKNDKDAGVTNKKDKGTAVSEKYQDTGTVNEKINGIAGVDEKHKGSATINEPDKDKNGGIKNREDVDNDREMKSKTFKAIGGERNGGEGGKKEEAELKNKASDSAGGGNREEYGSSKIKLNTEMYYTQYDNAYGYWPLQIFSDENPHSCSIM